MAAREASERASERSLKLWGSRSAETNEQPICGAAEGASEHRQLCIGATWSVGSELDAPIEPASLRDRSPRVAGRCTTGANARMMVATLAIRQGDAQLKYLDFDSLHRTSVRSKKEIPRDRQHCVGVSWATVRR